MIKIVEDVILKLQKDELENGNVSIIRVVSWNKSKPKLEKRMFYRDKQTDELKPGKAVGFDEEDWQLLISKQIEIDEALSKK